MNRLNENPKPLNLERNKVTKLTWSAELQVGKMNKFLFIQDTTTSEYHVVWSKYGDHIGIVEDIFESNDVPTNKLDFTDYAQELSTLLERQGYKLCGGGE